MMPHIESQAQRDALIADCKADIEWFKGILSELSEGSPTQRGYKTQLLRQQICLAALEAEITGWQFLGVNGKWLGLLDDFGKMQAEREGCEVRANYTVPPVPVLKPVVLPSRFGPAISPIIKGGTPLPSMRLSPDNGGWLNREGVIKAIREAGYPVDGQAEPFRETRNSSTESFRENTDSTTSDNHIPDAGKMTGWIKCGDVMPDRNRWVLTCDDAGVTKSYLCMHTGEWINEKGNELYAVSHWMPLPEAPHD